jgi:hypothetical protein
MPESTSFPCLAVLEHLQEYANASRDAHTEIKSCLWQLTKSRRNVRGVMMRGTTDFKAELLREDWRARHRLVNQVDEGDLVEERDDQTNVKSSSSSSSSIGSKPPQWKFQDVLVEKENSSKASSASISDTPTASTGLRQRKVNTDHTSNTEKSADSGDDATWTIVKEEDLEDEELVMLRKDPIEFFGGGLGAPRDLRVAQQHAKQAMEGYIQAANEVTKLLTIILKEKQKEEVASKQS